MVNALVAEAPLGFADGETASRRTPYGRQGYRCWNRTRGSTVFELIAFALSSAAVIIGFTQAKDFVSRRLRYVDAAHSPIAPLVAGAGAALIATPIVWMLPLVGMGTAIAFGLSVGFGVAAGNKEIRRSLPPG